MIKFIVLYGHPADPATFEKYYAQKHIPIAEKMPGVARWELTRFTAAADGSRPAYYRMAEIYFSSLEQMQKSLQSSAGTAAVKDLENFATGGVTTLVGETSA